MFQKKRSSAHEFYVTVQKRKEKIELNKTPSQKKIDELTSQLKSSRHNSKEQLKKLKEARKEITYLQSQLKNLKADYENLKDDYKLLQGGKKG